MLAGPKRLRLSRDIERVYKQGRYGNSDHLSIKALSRHSDATRAVVVVAKKVSKKAVVRNRLRRRLLEILAKNWQRLSHGYDIVISVKQDASSLSPTDLEQEVLAALTSAKVIK